MRDPRVLRAELVDHLTEAVAQLSDPAERAAVICAVVYQAVDAVAWRVGGEPDLSERDSLESLSAAALDHYRRMSAAGLSEEEAFFVPS